MTRLVTVLVTLAVPEEADAEDAAVCTALEVVSADGVEGHLPVPGRVIQHRSGRQPWRVETVTAGGAVLCNLTGDWVRMPLTALEPDQVERTVSSTGSGDRVGGERLPSQYGTCDGKPALARETSAGRWQLKVHDPTNLTAGHDGWVLLGTQWAALEAACTATGFTYRR